MLKLVKRAKHMKLLYILLYLSFSSILFAQDNPDSTEVTEEFKALEYFALVNDRYLSFKGDKIAITNDSGKIIVPYNTLYGNFMTVFNWDGDLYAYGTDVFQMVNDDSLMAIYNVIGDLQFDFKYPFVKPLRYQCEEGFNYRFLVKDNGKYTLRTTSDQPLIEEIEFDHLLGYWHKTDTYVVLQNDEILFIDLCEGTSFTSFNPKDDNRFESLQFNGKYGLVSCYGKIVLPFEFNELRYYGELDPTFPTYHDNGQGIADTSGIEIIPAIYDYVKRYCSNEIGNDIGHPFMAKTGDHFKLLIYSAEAKKFIRKTDFSFKSMDCDFDKNIGEYINRVETVDGKKGILNQDGTINWE